MKTNLSNFVRFTLTTLAVLLAFPIAVPARAQSDSLSGGKIIFNDGGIHVYDGSEWKSDYKVTLADGSELASDLEYTVKLLETGKNAGTYSVTVIGTGSYTGSLSANYTIVPRTVTPVSISCSKQYDGTTDAKPVLTLEDVVLGDIVTIGYTSAAYDTPSIGSGKTVHVNGLQLYGTDKDNYILSNYDIALNDCGSITPPPIEPQFKDAVLPIGSSPLDLRTLVSGARNSNDITFNKMSDTTGTCEFSFPWLIPGNTPGTVEFEVYVPPGEGPSSIYKGGMGTITITVVEEGTEPVPPGADDDKEPPKDPDSSIPGNPETPDDNTETGTKRQDPLVITGSSSMVYGESLNLGVVGGSGSGAVTYAITGGTGSGTIDQNGRLRATKVGTIWVTAFKAGDDIYQTRQSDAKVIAVEPAKITITAVSKTIQVGEAVPSFTRSDYTVSGLVGSDQLRTLPTLAYASTPDTSKAGTVAIHPAGAEVPAGGNYQPEISYVSGTLTIKEVKDFSITIQQSKNGTLSADRQSAEEGSTVILTAAAEDGFIPEVPVVTYQGIHLVVADNGNGSYAFSMPSGPVTVTASFVPKPADLTPIFSDVQSNDWFSDNVAYVCQNGLMVGTSQNTFSPNDTTTRGMMVTILYRADGSPAASSQSHYVDVDSSAYYAAPVSWASWYGIASGYSENLFGPEDSISRQQLATILYRYAAYKNFDVSARGNLVQFSDRGQISDYAMDALSWANATGLISGKGDQILAPDAPTTRAEMAAILQRFCQKYDLLHTP